MNSKTLTELRALTKEALTLAKESGLRDYYKMKRQVLIDALSAHHTRDPDTMTSMKLPELKALAKEAIAKERLAKERGLRGYSKMKKQVLIDALSAHQTPDSKNT